MGINATETQTEYIQGLRELADFLERSIEESEHELYDNPADSYYGVSLYQNVTRHKDFNPELKEVTGNGYEIDVEATQLELAKWLNVLGPGTEKNYSDYDFRLTKKFGPHTIVISAETQVVCKTVVVGTEEIPEQIIPASTREITERVCAKISFKGILADSSDEG